MTASITATVQPFFDACARGELRLQTCQLCQRCQFYPRIRCVHCGGDQLAWTTAGGRGVVASYTVVRRAVSAAHAAPYVIALVDLDEGVRMMTHIVDVDPDSVHTGQIVEVQFQSTPTVADGAPLPVFRPVDLASSGASE